MGELDETSQPAADRHRRRPGGRRDASAGLWSPAQGSPDGVWRAAWLPAGLCGGAPQAPAAARQRPGFECAPLVVGPLGVIVGAAGRGPARRVADERTVGSGAALGRRHDGPPDPCPVHPRRAGSPRPAGRLAVTLWARLSTVPVLRARVHLAGRAPALAVAGAAVGGGC